MCFSGPRALFGGELRRRDQLEWPNMFRRAGLCLWVPRSMVMEMMEIIYQLASSYKNYVQALTFLDDRNCLSAGFQLEQWFKYQYIWKYFFVSFNKTIISSFQKLGKSKYNENINILHGNSDQTWLCTLIKTNKFVQL
jgi:hypothetical protein